MARITVVAVAALVAACADPGGGTVGDDTAVDGSDTARRDAADTGPAVADTAPDGRDTSGTITCSGVGDCEALDDGKVGPCVEVACVNGGCRLIATNHGQTCDDGDPCSGDGVCRAGSCVDAGAVDCADDDPCTVDSCHPKDGCVHTVTAGLPCDDGVICTVDDVCTADGGCAGTQRTCDDLNDCTADTCDPSTGFCNSRVTPGADCDDGNACTDDDVCQGDGTCGGRAATCTDDDPCTDNWCDTAIGCRVTPRCDDRDPCTTDHCDPSGPTCTYTPKAEGGACDDAYACTTSDQCLGGECVGTPVACPEGDACELGACVPAWVEIPAGTFWMGCNTVTDTQCYQDEAPQHLVQLSAYEIQRFEVTQGDYDACVAAGTCTANPSAADKPCSADPLHPASCVTWYQANTFCRDFAGGRLPTEAEWERAASGGCERYPGEDCATSMPKYPWGNDRWTCEHAVALPSSCGLGTKLHKVGSHPLGISPYGLHDMAGNVSEWVADWYADHYTADAATDPLGPPEGTQKVLRGGQYNAFEVYFLRTSLRIKGAPSGGTGAPGLGFRCVR